jgi:hypothetical protein
MARTLDDWLKLAKGLQVSKGNGIHEVNSDFFRRNLDVDRKNRAFSRSYNISTEFLETLETILSHCAVNKNVILITDDDFLQISVKFDLDVRITIELSNGKCFCDPYLESVTDLKSLLAALEDPSLVIVVSST